MTYLLFAVALSLSTVAEWYAIVGLMAIFAAASTPIMVMGILLGAAKLVIASWLYRNWKEVPILLRSYFTIALVILMFLTSMGIFGFLSKAHLDQAVPTGDIAAKVSLYDEKIKVAKDNIDANRKALKQLDESVDQVMARSADEKGADKAVAIRRSQVKERTRLLGEIQTEQATVSKLMEESAPIRAEARKVEAEVGPIKYIAAVIYEDKADGDVLEKAVRFVIMMIVSVFDPLAVLLLIAANWNMKRNQQPSWTEFFNKKPEEPAEVKLEDDVYLDEKPDVWVADVGEKPTEEELLEIEEEPTPSEWSPEMYNRVRNNNESNKTKSFLDKVNQSIGVKSIEQEVEEIQLSDSGKVIEYDSAGRRVTP
jgi:hypothetical protein